MRHWVEDIHSGCTGCWTVRDCTLGNCLLVLILLLALSVLGLHSASNVWPLKRGRIRRLHKWTCVCHTVEPLLEVNQCHVCRL